MAIKSADQISIVDVTDAYSVVLTSESHTFPGSTSAALAGSVTTQVIAMCGANQVAAKVTVSEITKPSGVTVTSNGDSIAPTLTITLATSVTAGGVVKIPVHIGDITIIKEFSFAIAFKGSTGATGAAGKGVKSTEVKYQASSSGTTIPTGTWNTSIPTVNAGQFLWTRTVITYTDDSSSTSYSVGMMGATGATGDKGDKGDTGATGKGVKSTTITYAKSSNGTTAPSSGWGSSVPSASAGEYVWSKTVITYTDNTTSTTYSVGMIGATGSKGDKGDTGATGAAGADAITLSITSSNGTIFKNSSIATVLTAHVYKAGVELTASQIAALGTVKWYKDGGTTAVGTGTTLTINAGQVTNKATYIAQLEG